MNLRPLACALALCLTAVVASPAEAARKKRAPAKPSAPAVTACTDFYSFANADWLKAHPVASGADAHSALGELNQRARQQQIDLLDAAMRAPQGNVQKLLGDFWASGLDEAAIERDGATPIAPLLARINAIKRAKDIPASIAALHQVGIPVAFHFGADVDLAEMDRHIGYFGQGGLGLPDPAFYTRNDATSREVLNRYQDYIKRILTLTGTADKQLEVQVRQVIDLETRIASAARPMSELRDPRRNHAPVLVAEFAKKYKRLQLAEFLKAQGVNDDRVSLANAELFAQLDTMVGKVKPEQWKTYLRWRVGDVMAPYLSRPWREAHFDFNGRLLQGMEQMPDRQQQVLEAINLAAGPMLGREYVARYLPATTRSRAEEIAAKVRDAMAAALDRDQRLGVEAKAEAKAKLAQLKIEVGAPRRDLDYTVQPMGRGSFGSNMLIASSWRHREEMKRIGRGNAERRWNVLPQQPALAYDLSQNRLIVSAAILQPPVLDMSQSLASQYGSLGAMLGHELSHAFDQRGRMVDAKHDVRDWWSASDSAAWTTLANRVASQYSALPYPGIPGVRVNGERVRDVAIADLAGIELATAAMQASLPKVAKSDQQALYQGWARLWPQQWGIEVATEHAATSSYAPGQWRTNATLMNQPDFAAAFGCKAGTAMQLKADQQISLWR